MVRSAFSVLIVFAAALLQADWTRRADIQGNITDIAIAADQSTYYVATDGAGVWTWDTFHWVERNNGLFDLRVRAIAVKPDDPYFIKAATISGLVYYSGDGGQNWALDGNGLQDIAVPYMPTDLVMVLDPNFYGPGSGEWVTYMSTLGSGVLRELGLVGGLWGPYNPGIHNMDLLSIGAQTETVGSPPRHRAVAGSRYTPDGSHESHLYVLDQKDGWLESTAFSPSLPADVSFPSIAYHQADFAAVGTSVDGTGTGHGVYYSDMGTTQPTWLMACANPPNQGFIGLDYFYNGYKFTITGGTPLGLWKIDDPTDCGAGSAYTGFTRSRGKMKAVGIINDASGIAGGPGRGPIRFVPATPLSPVINVRTDLSDYNILDIAPSPSFGSSDDTIFTASGIAGIYKNIDAVPCASSGVGYFYRMVGDPDSWGTVPVLKVRPVPGYSEDACQPNRMVYAATAGQGVMRSDDGGRSWSFANGTQNQLGNGIITDLVFHPAYGTNNRLYAAVYGKGVFWTDDGGGNWTEAVTMPDPMPNPRILCLGFGSGPGYPLYAGCRTVNISGSNSWALCVWNGAAWGPSGTMDMVYPKSISALGIYRSGSPASDYLYAGTEDHGVWRSINGGANFSAINDLPLSPGYLSGARIFDLKLSPDFAPASNSSLLLVVGPAASIEGGVYYTDHTKIWKWTRLDSTLPAPPLPADGRILSAAFSPAFSGRQGQIFCGHATQGLYTARISGVLMACGWRKASGFFDVPPDIAGLAVVPDDPTTVFAATARDGVFISRDAGDTFQPWGANLTASGCPVESTLAVAVTHAAFSPSANVYLNENFTGGIPGTWTIDNGGTAQTWKASVLPPSSNPCYRYISASWDLNFAIIDSDCESPSGTQDDVLFSPWMDTSTASSLTLKFDHYFRRYPNPPQEEHGYVFVYSSGTGWVLIADFTGSDFGPESVSLDLTPYRDANFRLAFYYTGSYDWYWAIDHVWLGEAVNRVVVGTKDHGIYYADYDEWATFGNFIHANVTAGTVNEIRYQDLAEDMRASHVPDGDYHSADYGTTWTQVPGVTSGLGLRDVNYSLSGYWDRGLSAFIWGCSSGKSLSRGVGDGAAWYYSPSLAYWQECPQTGLDPNGDYRSVLQLSSTTVLMGSIGKESSTIWQGLYRSDDSCATWRPSGAGLPDNPQVYAFQANSADGYVLASVVDSNLTNGDDGGVFYSETSSGGRAWAKTYLPSSTPSSYDMAAASDGSALYTGLSSDGIFSTFPSSIAIAKPAAYFEVESAVCIGSAVQFHNYSAGRVTIHAWAFGDGDVSAQSSPSHIFASTGTYYPTLHVTSGTKTDEYPDSPNGVSIEVRTALDAGETLRLAKTGTPGEVRLSWADLVGETGYQVWASYSAASGSPYGPMLGPEVTAYHCSPAVPPNECAYFRVQPLDPGFGCTGIVGGGW